MKSGVATLFFFHFGRMSIARPSFIDGLFGEDDQEVEVRSSGPVIRPGAASVKDNGNKVLAINLLKSSVSSSNIFSGFSGLPAIFQLFKKSMPSTLRPLPSAVTLKVPACAPAAAHAPAEATA